MAHAFFTCSIRGPSPHASCRHRRRHVLLRTRLACARQAQTLAAQRQPAAASKRRIQRHQHHTQRRAHHELVCVPRVGVCSARGASKPTAQLTGAGSLLLLLLLLHMDRVLVCELVSTAAEEEAIVCVGSGRISTADQQMLMQRARDATRPASQDSCTPLRPLPPLSLPKTQRPLFFLCYFLCLR